MKKVQLIFEHIYLIRVNIKSNSRANLLTSEPQLTMKFLNELPFLNFCIVTIIVNYNTIRRLVARFSVFTVRKRSRFQNVAVRIVVEFEAQVQFEKMNLR